MKRVFLALAAMLALGQSAYALPWAAPGDAQLRHDLRLLNDHGLLHMPITTWPIALTDVDRAVSRVNAQAVGNKAIARALTRVKARLNYEKAAYRLRWRKRVSVTPEPFELRSFDYSPRERVEAMTSFDYVGGDYAINLAVTGVVADDDNKTADDDEEVRFDGTYVAAVIDDWALIAGMQARHWGPMHDTSLIWSTNARPIPGLSISRINSRAFETPWLSWIGPWNLEAMLGQLEDERHIADALFFGMRLTFKPDEQVEIGLSRTAMWGGEGRSERLDVFWDLLIGNDNRGGDGISSENEPGNQLAGIDWRVNFPLLGGYGAFYGQMIGEDEANGFPSKYLMGSGFSWVTDVGDSSLRVGLEGIKTDADGAFNVAYEHTSIYRSGYRYYGRSIGASADNDAKLLTLYGEFNDGDYFYTANVRFGDLNDDGVTIADHPFPAGGRLKGLDLGVKVITSYGRFSLSGQVLNIDNDMGRSTDGGVQISWEAVQ